ncbi:MAG: 7TM diverse intracellular signaling domain-containing protein [Myxococcota bacterium]|nr:7TM diverse intracellular signaling domain-containing protein [Myxococcota bacterium]
MPEDFSKTTRREFPRLVERYRLIVFLALALSQLHCSSESSEFAATATDGILDLTQWNPNRDGPVSTKGQWRFAWNQDLTPGPIEPVWRTYRDQLTTSRAWLGQPLIDEQQSTVPSMGFGTYLLRVRLPEMKQATLSLLIPATGSPTRFLITDTEGTWVTPPIHQGQVSTHAEHTFPNRITVIRSLGTIEGLSEVVIWATVSNFHQRSGGLYFSPTLGLRQAIDKAYLSAVWLEAFVLGVLVIIALYHLVIFFQRREDKVALFFACFCGAVALRQVIMMHIADHLATDWALNAHVWSMRIEYASMPLMAVFAGIFVRSLLSSTWFELMFKGWASWGAALVAGTLISQPLLFTHYLWVYQLHIVIGIVAIFSHVVQHVFKKTPLAFLFLLSFGTLATGAINDILYSHNIIETAHITPYCFVVFVLLQSSIIARHFSTAFEERDKLYQRVLSQTAQIAQESEARSQAEHQLRLEAESKVVLFGDAVHHLNNPINHIVGSVEAISVEQVRIRDTITELIAGAEGDPEAERVNTFFTTRFDSVSRKIDATTQAVERASSTIELLRVLSGMDGISFERTTMGEVLELSRKRVGPFLDCLDLRGVDTHADTTCVGHPGLYSQGLDLLISRITTHVDGVCDIGFVDANQGDYHQIVIHLGPKQADHNPSEWAPLFDLIGHLLKPYECQARLTATSVELDILAEGKRAQILANASRQGRKTSDIDLHEHT